MKIWQKCCIKKEKKKTENFESTKTIFIRNQNAEPSLCYSILIDVVIRWALFDFCVLDHWYFMLGNFCLLCEWHHQGPELQCELLMSTVSAPSWWVFSSSFMCTSYWYLPYELTMPSIFYIVYKWEEQEPGIWGEFLNISPLSNTGLNCVDPCKYGCFQ